MAFSDRRYTTDRRNKPKDDQQYRQRTAYAVDRWAFVHRAQLYIRQRQASVWKYKRPSV